jgi:hypothetical protein
MKKSILFVCGIFLLVGKLAVANVQLQAVTIEELSWMDKNKMQQQEDKIKEIARSKLGTNIHRNWSDIALLQSMIDKKLVGKDDFAIQEAMGVILGNIMQADFPSHLQWKVYKDKQGRSKALCVVKTQECLFPITMLSRRMQLEMAVNVASVYDNAINEIAFVLPKMPYGDELLHQLKR